MRQYRCLNNKEWTSSAYSLVPIRDEDKLLIMQWRNEQIYHLRQNKILTEEDQENYFKNSVSKLFIEDSPGQLLFSYLESGMCIGYGGLVHINWVDKHAEISFIMNTQLEKDHFALHWSTYLGLIQQIAFKELNLHKLFTYAYDIRPHLYAVLESSGFRQEAVLKEHCLFEGKYIDVIIHSRLSHGSK